MPDLGEHLLARALSAHVYGAAQGGDRSHLRDHQANVAGDGDRLQ